MNELKPWFGKPPHVTAPDLPGHRLASHERLDLGKITVVGLLLIPMWAIAITGVIAALGGRTSYSIEFTFTGLILVFVVLVAIIIVHEIIHGLVAALMGARPAFGMGPGFAYTTFLEPMGKAAYLVVGIAPLAVMTPAAVAIALAWPAAAGWMIAAATINASGSIGDLWMAARILRAPAGATFYDLADGFAVLVPDRDEPSHSQRFG